MGEWDSNFLFLISSYVVTGIEIVNLADLWKSVPPIGLWRGHRPCSLFSRVYKRQRASPI